MPHATLWTACDPRPEVLRTDLDADALFMANFGQVIRGAGEAVYKDAKQFFDTTYPTDNLKRVCGDVFKQLANTSAGGGVRLSTGFGGGKSHALIALWHLGHNFQDPSIGPAFVPAGQRTFAVRTIALDLSRTGANEVEVHPDGTVTRTLWGELAYLLGAYDEFREDDENWARPRAEKLEKLLGQTPTLILIDELSTYLAALEPLGKGRAEALLSFFQQLTQIVAQTPRVVLVWSEPTGMAAFAGQTDQIQAATSTKLAEVGRRVSGVTDPIGEDFEAVILKRLFSRIDEDFRNRTEQAYAQLAQAAREADSNFFQNPNPQDFAARVRRCFPLSPALFDSARQLATIPAFNSSRGALRLFAQIVRDAWTRQGKERLIAPGDLSWNSELQAELLTGIGKQGFGPVCATDIHVHAEALDEGTPARLHRRVASAVLLASLPQQANGGLSLTELAPAVLTPDDDAVELGDVSHALLRECHYLYEKGQRFEFRTEVNVNKLIQDRATGINYEDTRRLVEETVAKAYGKGNFHDAVKTASEPEDVSDSAVGPRLFLAPSATNARLIVESRDAADPYGNRPPRVYAPQVLVLAPEPAQLQRAVGTQQRLTAAEQIRAELQKDRSQKEALAQVEERVKDLRREAKLEAIRAYSRLVRMGSNGPVEYSLAEAAYFGKGETTNLADPLLEWLVQKGQALTVSSPALGGIKVERLYQAATKTEGDAATTQELLEALRRDPGGPAVFKSDALRTGILNAVAEGRLIFQNEQGDAYDKHGSVSGEQGARRRQLGPKPWGVTFSDSCLVAGPDTPAAQFWLREDAVKAEPEPPSGESPSPDDPPAPRPVTSLLVDGWHEVLRRRHEGYAVVRAAGSGKDALVLAAQVLGIAGDLARVTTVIINGTLSGGGKLRLEASNLGKLDFNQSRAHFSTVANLAAQQQQIALRLEVADCGAADWLEQVSPDSREKLSWEAEVDPQGGPGG